jgi:glucokinase
MSCLLSSSAASVRSASSSARAEDVVAHRREGLVGAAGQPGRVGGLLQERLDPLPVVRGLDDAEGGGLTAGDGDARDRHPGAPVEVLTPHLAGVHAVDVVGTEDDDEVGALVVDEVQRLEDRVGRAGVPARAQALLRRHRGHVVAEQVRQPPRRRDVAVQAVALVLGEDGDPEDAGVDEVGQREVDQPVQAPERHGGLARSSVSGASRVPAPPASTIPRILGCAIPHLLSRPPGGTDELPSPWRTGGLRPRAATSPLARAGSHHARREARPETGPRPSVAAGTGPPSLLPVASGVRREQSLRCSAPHRTQSRGATVALAIGVDIGGTKVAAGVVDEHGAIVATSRRDTPSQDPSKIEEIIGDVVRELQAAHDVEAVGVGAAGFVDAAAPPSSSRQPGLAGRAAAGRRRGPVRAACRRGERRQRGGLGGGPVRRRAGAGLPRHPHPGHRLGGGLVVDGQLYRGRLGIAAEFGHLTVEPGGRRCGCGGRGCWERYASGRALVREAQELASISPAIASRLLELAGGRPEAITGLAVTQAAQDGDEAALEAFRVVGTWLGHGMASLAAVLDPGMFVLGGGVSAAGELVREPAARTLQERITARAYREVPGVRLAELGPEAGIVGAADLARRR